MTINSSGCENVQAAKQLRDKILSSYFYHPVMVAASANLLTLYLLGLMTLDGTTVSVDAKTGFPLRP